MPGSAEQQSRRLCVTIERDHSDGGCPKDGFNACRREVADMKPDNFRRSPMQRASLKKVAVLGNNNVAVALRKFPEFLVVRAIQPDVAHVGRLRINVRKKRFRRM